MICMFLAPGFEEIEAIVTRDVLKKANIDVKTVGIKDSVVESTNGLKVISDLLIDSVSHKDIEGIILPGGMPGTTNLNECDKLVDLIKFCMENKLLIAAICAAPSILGRLGFLEGKDACCYPGIEGYLKGAKINKNDVNVCENIITSRGPGTAFQFAFSIVEYIRGSETRSKLEKSMQFSR